MKLTILSLLLILILPSAAFACTSFALYGNQVFYGMNFDYFAVPLKFLIESRPETAVFHLTFLFEHTINDPAYRGYFAKTCGMNAMGLFCASQEVEPFIQGQKVPAEGQTHIDDQYETLSACSRVSQVREKIAGTQWIQFIGPSIHNLFADSEGHAMVTETDNTRNFITGIEGKFMVMANFANHSLAGKSYREARGAGAERFRIAHEYLSENAHDFSVEKGFRMLKKARCKDKGMKTLCSLVCHPETRTVYIALNLNMDRIWKVCLASKTIETFEGYRRYRKATLGENGMLSQELAQFGV